MGGWPRSGLIPGGGPGRCFDYGNTAGRVLGRSARIVAGPAWWHRARIGRARRERLWARGAAIVCVLASLSTVSGIFVAAGTSDASRCGSWRSRSVAALQRVADDHKPLVSRRPHLCHGAIVVAAIIVAAIIVVISRSQHEPNSPHVDATLSGDERLARDPSFEYPLQHLKKQPITLRRFEWHEAMVAGARARHWQPGGTTPRD